MNNLTIIVLSLSINRAVSGNDGYYSYFESLVHLHWSDYWAESHHDHFIDLYTKENMSQLLSAQLLIVEDLISWLGYQHKGKRFQALVIESSKNVINK